MKNGKFEDAFPACHVGLPEGKQQPRPDRLEHPALELASCSDSQMKTEQTFIVVWVIYGDNTESL